MNIHLEKAGQQYKQQDEVSVVDQALARRVLQALTTIRDKRDIRRDLWPWEKSIESCLGLADVGVTALVNIIAKKGWVHITKRHAIRMAYNLIPESRR